MSPEKSVQPTFGQRAAAQHLYPLWQMNTLHQTGEPQPRPACHWRWPTLQPLINEAIHETSMGNAERRVLLLGNPAYANAAGDPHVTPALQTGIQTLLPGESARAHRHTPNALRLVMEDGGETFTLVNGKPCRMQRGDVILTPAHTWHSHFNKGRSRSVWLDVLDSQLTNYFDAGFFEPSSKMAAMPCTVDDDIFKEAGFAPELPEGVARTYSPRFRFPWTSSLEALEAAPVLSDGSSRVRLTNPTGNDLAMPLMDCGMVSISKHATKARRSTAAAVCVVAEGSGVSILGDQEVRWSENDVFTLPQWTWNSHRAETERAIIFIVSDREVQRRLNLLQEQQA